MAKKISGVSKFIMAILGLSADKLFDMGAEGATKLLEQGWKESPQIVSAALPGIYPLIDVLLEKYVKDTKSKIDDKFVAELKEVVELFAAAHEVNLPNLDDD